MVLRDMYGQSRLQKRGGVYYFRATIPQDLQAHFGRKETIFSLRTKDFREAKRLCRQASVAFDENVDALRNQRPPEVKKEISSLDHSVIRTLCDYWRYQCLSTDAWARAQGLSDAEFDDAKAQRAETLEALKNILAKGQLEKIAPALQQFLHLINVDFCGPPEQLRQLSWAFLETVIETHQATMRRDQGEVVPVPEAPRHLLGQAKVHDVESTSADPGFEECFAIWKTAVTNRPDKTVSDFQSVMLDFIKWAGDRPVSQYDREDAYGYASHVRQRDQLDPATVDKKITYLRAIYNAAKLRRKLPENPFSNVAVPQDRIKKTKRLPYDHDDLIQIFSAPIYTGDDRPLGGAGEAAVWLPLLGLFTGARLEELAQLRETDICMEQGIDYLHITDLVSEIGGMQPVRSLKNAHSRRKLPIHPELIRAGFFRYVEQVRANKGDFIFPLLRRDCHGKLSGNWSKWWGRYRRVLIGIHSPLKPFHSFRHTFRDACREAELDEEVADALMGHTSSERTGRGYGRGFTLRVLHRAIVKIQYPALTIPALIKED